MTEVRERVTVENYELIGITETCATESVNDAELCIEGYNMFRKDRGSRGGGLILYIKNTMRASLSQSQRGTNALTVCRVANRYGVMWKLITSNYWLGCSTEVLQAQRKMMRNYYW